MQYTVFQYFLNHSVTPRALQMDVDYAHQNQEMLSLNSLLWSDASKRKSMPATWPQESNGHLDTEV